MIERGIMETAHLSGSDTQALLARALEQCRGWLGYA
jgi:hypothetical protein